MPPPDAALFLDDLATPMSPDAVVSATADGYSVYMGDDPFAHTLAVLVAQILLETGNGQKMRRYNAGNVKWSADWTGKWTMFRCSEIIGGQARWFDPPNPQTWFRAFERPDEGMLAQVAFLAGRERYREAWGWIFKGDPDQAVRALARAGYFTANVDTYARAVTSIYTRVLPSCERCVGGRNFGIPELLRAEVDELVTLSGYDPSLRDLRLGEDLAA